MMVIICLTFVSKLIDGEKRGMPSKEDVIIYSNN